jgi:hypothetical protein
MMESFFMLFNSFSVGLYEAVGKKDAFSQNIFFGSFAIGPYKGAGEMLSGPFFTGFALPSVGA